eukprot:GHVU01004565.1.p1 GENE.GHVU01004565.1~~GHVU01004565.1.p1  ORF type:complete len:302 (-),score=46.00 GHVU01004565.1:263-1168(-)
MAPDDCQPPAATGAVAAPMLKLANGVEIPSVGLGTYRLAEPEVCRNSVRWALNAGYRLVDTASAYRNEEHVGEELAAHYKRGGAPVFVTSKANPSEMGYEGVLEAYERSRQKLDVPQLDLYLLHWPGASKHDLATPMGGIRRESWKAMEKLYKEGRVRAIGVSNYMVPHLTELLEDGVEVVPMLNQVELHPLCWSQALVDCCNKHSVVLQAYASLGSTHDDLLQHPVVKEVAKESQRSEAQVLLRWGLDHGFGVIPQSKREAHIRDNLAVAAAAPLEGSHRKRLDEISIDHHTCWNPYTVK